MTTLPEELLLISLDEDGHPRNPRSALGPALAGAVLADLLVGGHLAMRDGRVTATPASTGGIGDPILDGALDQVRAEGKARTLKWWVGKLGGGPWRNDAVRSHVIDQLTAKGVLTKGSSRLLGLFERAAHLPADPALPTRLRERVRALLLSDEEPGERDAALVGLVEVSGLVDACVARDERREARAAAKRIARGEGVSEAVRKLQEEVMTAVYAAVAASVVTSSGDGGSTG